MQIKLEIQFLSTNKDKIKIKKRLIRDKAELRILR